MSVPRPQVRRCVRCGRTRTVEEHHVGGRNHIAWFTMPCCRECHEKFHVDLGRAGVNLQFTRSVKLRLIRAMQAALVFIWMLLDALKRELQSEE